mgnify:CR=1 FL=1
MELANVLSGVSSVISSVVSACTGNPVTMAVIGMSVVGVGVGLFRKLLRVGK